MNIHDGLEDAVKALEATQGSGDDTPPTEQRQQPDKQPDQPDEAGDEPLDLTDDQVADDDSDNPGDDDGGDGDDDGGKKRRSKPEGKRIAELTARLRQTERELEQLKEGRQQDAPEEKAPDRPKPEDFEYGEADPAYVEALTDWKLETRDFEKRKTDAAQAEQREMVGKIQSGMAKAQEDARAKYEDFEDRIAEAVEARGGESLPPMLAVGVALSPVGGDLTYRLATDEAASDRLEALARSPATTKQLAIALGELEGEYITDMTDADLDMSDELDVMRAMGRMRARVAGRTAKAPEAAPQIVPTNAPEPPERAVRGSAGKARASVDTEDTAAFARDFASKLGLG